MSMGQFMPFGARGGGVDGEWSFVDYAEGNGSNVTLSDWVAGDLVFVFTRGLGAGATSPTWNESILLGTASSASYGTWMVKIMQQGDGSSIVIPGSLTAQRRWMSATLRWSGGGLSYVASGGDQVDSSGGTVDTHVPLGDGNQIVLVSGNTGGTTSFSRSPNDYEFEIVNSSSRYLSFNSNYSGLINLSSSGSVFAHKGIHWIQFA